jgi:hypothetical protein
MRTIFRQYKDGEVIAVFPDEPTHDDPVYRAACLLDGFFMNVDPAQVIKNTKPAPKVKYARLLRMLKKDKELEIEVDEGGVKMKAVHAQEDHAEKVELNRRRFHL